MAKAKQPSDYTPEGRHTIIPRIVAHDAKGLVEFLKTVLGAAGEYHQDAPAEVTIGDSVIMISDAGVRPPAPAFLYVYVSDTDATYHRAVQAGARVVEEPADQFYGDRRCMVIDKWGNTWQIATHLRVSERD